MPAELQLPPAVETIGHQATDRPAGGRIHRLPPQHRRGRAFREKLRGRKTSIRSRPSAARWPRLLRVRREEVVESIKGQKDQAKGTAEGQTADVGFDDGDPSTDLFRFPGQLRPEECQHGGGDVDRHELVSGAGQGDGQPPGTGPDLEKRSLRRGGVIQIEGEIV